jgi:hypothetical protein
MEISINDYDVLKLQHRSWGMYIATRHPERLDRNVARSLKIIVHHWEVLTPRSLSDFKSRPTTVMRSPHFSSLSLSSDCHFPRRSPIVSVH